MTHTDVFLRDIFQTPDDDTPRLIFADWLDDHGDESGRARAELIRIQCAQARAGEDDEARPALRQRERCLLARHQGLWLGPLAQRLEDWEFRRGFLEVVTLPAKAFLEDAAGLFCQAPVRALNLGQVLMDDAGDVAALARSPQLARLASLILRCDTRPYARGGRSLPDIAGLLASGHLSGLQWLEVHGADPAAVVAAAGNPALAGLRSLTVHSGGGLAAVAGSPHFTALSRLYLYSLLPLGDGTPAEAGALFGSRLLSRLEELEWSFAGLGEEGVRALLGGPMSRLRRLRLCSVGLGAEGARSLAGVAGLAGLEWLDLGGNHIRGAGAEALAASPHLGGLRALRLSGNPLGPAGARALAVWRHPRRLRSLHLSADDLGDAAAVLAHSPAVEELHTLDLSHNDLTVAGVASLAASPRLARLTSLRLDGNLLLGDDGVCALAASPHLSGLVELSLSGCNVRDRGTEALAGSPHLGRLEALRLDRNAIGAAGLRALAGSPFLARLTDLSLRGNSFGRDGIPALAAAPLLARLHRLDLSDNAADDADAEALARSAGLGGLHTLLLDRNVIGDRGAAALAAAAHLGPLLALDLAGNRIGPEGVRALAAAPRLGPLARVNLWGNALSPEEQAALRALGKWFRV
jgi:uncharacterized protein (TIGR02996 family)